MRPTEQRSSVRANFPFKVQFKVLTREEYETIKRSDDAMLSKGNRGLAIETTGSDERNNVAILNSSLTDFLIRIDEKLDRVMAILSKDLPDKEVFNQGKGESIGGSGMTLKGGIPVELGQIIHVEVTLSKFPLTFIDLFGKVVWVSPVDEEGATMYRLGLEFIDLDPNDSEKIIACVFEKQRENNRKRKSESYEN